MATRKPVIVDPRQAEMHKMDAEIARLKELVAHKREAIAADERLHALDQDCELQKRTKGEIRKIENLIAEQQDRRFKTEIGETLAAPKKTAAPVDHRAWDIDENILRSSEPKYPALVRGSSADKDDVFSQAYLAIKVYYEALVMDYFRKDGFHPDNRVPFDFVTSLQGEVMANFRWYSDRCQALEARVAELESKPSVEYRGVWRSNEEYRRGNLVTHDGSMWHAEIVSNGLIPGDGTAAWKLCVKKGKDGRP